MTKLPKGYTKFSALKKQLFKDLAFKAMYEKSDAEWQIITLLVHMRSNQGLTQTQLAKKLGISQPAISKIERGEYSPSIKVLRRITSALGGSLTIRLIPNVKSKIAPKNPVEVIV